MTGPPREVGPQPHRGPLLLWPVVDRCGAPATITMSERRGAHEGRSLIRSGDGSPVVVPSVIDELARRSWTREALCATEGRADQPWVLTTSYGRESARTVVDCFAVCAECPVRTSCLADADQRDAWSVMGVWGGTVMTERTRAVAAARRQDPDASEAEIRDARGHRVGGDVREPVGDLGAHGQPWRLPSAVQAHRRGGVAWT